MQILTRSDKDRRISLNWDRINAYTARRKPGHQFRVDIVPVDKAASDAFRGYYYAAVLPGFMMAYHYDADDAEVVHYFLKAKFFRCEKDEHDVYRNVPSVFSKSKKKLRVTKEDREAFVEWVIRKAAEAGVYIEDPK